MSEGAIVVHLLGAIGDIGLSGEDDRRILNSGQGFKSGPTLVLRT